MIKHRFDVLDSTNVCLMKMAEKGAPSWTVVLADTQTEGMGRSGRFWWSPPGSLYMSVLVNPAIGTGKLPRLPILASLAVYSALEGLGIPIRCKWPNDILMGGKKLAGILTQVRTSGDKVLWAVIGFGVNIRRPEGGTPEKIGEKIAFLDDSLTSLNRDQLAEAIVIRLKERLNSLDDDTWRKAVQEWTRSASWNVVYTHRDRDREIRGTPVRLAEDGGLVLLTSDGEVTVYSGEMVTEIQNTTSQI
jgi:BirA family biotin operon repressor/biotin-[acetyl-CoA-carboxylase] ligase